MTRSPLFWAGIATFAGTFGCWCTVRNSPAVVSYLAGEHQRRAKLQEEFESELKQRPFDWSQSTSPTKQPERGSTPHMQREIPRRTAEETAALEKNKREQAIAKENAPGMGAPGMSAGVEQCEVPRKLRNDGTISRHADYVQLLSKTYEVDKLYKSMQGPWGEDNIRLLDSPTSELVWLTGVDVQMVSEDGSTPMPSHFMCHVNFDLNMATHNRLLGLTKQQDGRLFTLSQGQLHVHFPEGFGIPMMSHEAIRVITQALNLNFTHRSFKVRHLVKLHFLRDATLSEPITPLYECGVSSLRSLSDSSQVYDYTLDGNLAPSGPLESMCLPGQKANARDEQTDRYGNKFTGHWVVKPGREVNRTRVTTIMRLPFDTTAHHVAVHVHPFAESLELRDLTTNTSVFKSQAKNYRDLVGLENVDYISSPEGIALYKDHEYELISVYNNPTQKDSDSMAVFYMYLRDHEFQKPGAPKFARK